MDITPTFLLRMKGSLALTLNNHGLELFVRSAYRRDLTSLVARLLYVLLPPSRRHSNRLGG